MEILLLQCVIPYEDMQEGKRYLAFGNVMAWHFSCGVVSLVERNIGTERK